MCGAVVPVGVPGVLVWGEGDGGEGSEGSGQFGGGADGGPIVKPRPGILLRRNMFGPAWLCGYAVETLLRGIGSAGGEAGWTWVALLLLRLVLGRATRLTGREEALGSGRGPVGGAVMGAREKFWAF